MNATSAAVLGAIVVVWIPLLFFIISRVTGWGRLARANPRTAPAPDAVRSFGSMAMGAPMLGYNNCVRFRADDDHLHIGLMPPFGWLFHPWMSIPWAKVEFIDGGRKSPLLRRVGLRVDGVATWVPAKAVEREMAVREALEG